MGFTRSELEGFRDAEVPDLVGDDVRLAFVGINPGLWTAATQTHFAHPGNRFYPALRLAGIIDDDIDRVNGMSDDDRARLIARGIAITNLVRRATARADELTADELRNGRQQLAEFVDRHQPQVLAIAGITAFRTAFGAKSAKAGRQPERLGSSEVWVVPNPSGLNAHETIESLAQAYAEPARAAGVLSSSTYERET